MFAQSVLTKSTLVEELAHAIQGDVRSTPMDRALYSTDASSYQVIPSCVILPKDKTDIVTTMQIAHRRGASIVPRGGGTSLSGQTIGEGIVLDLSRHMNQVLGLNVRSKWVRVQSGIPLANLNRLLAPHGLMVGPDPASAVTATIGGMTGNNSTGSHSIRYGMMADHVKEVDVVLSDGSHVRFGPKTPEEVEIILAGDTLESRIYREMPRLIETYADAIRTRYPKIWRNVAGYNLHRVAQMLSSGGSINYAPLIVGSEGTLGVITSVKLGLVEKPKHTYLAIVHFDDLRQTLETVPLILKHNPAAVELVDSYYNNLTRKSAEYGSQIDIFIDGDPRAVLIVEFYGETTQQLVEYANALEDDLRASGCSGTIIHRANPDEIAQVWNVRKAGLGLLMSKRGDAKPLAFVDDASVPIENLADYALEVEQFCQKLGVEAAFFAHASAGCLHINPVVNPKTVEGLATMRQISEAVMDIAIRHGGTTTGEHGEGFARSIYNEKLYGAELHRAFRQVKGLFDPNNRMNPGKIIDAPEPWDPSLMRLSPAYTTPYAPNATFFDYSEDGGFAGLVEMCNGQGVCRKTESGIMCPSYMATRDEAHSTRGRANALRSAMSGQLGADGLLSDELYEVLDLCLECKACKRECPSMVDMAKLKYEFLAQYQDKKGVSLRSWLFGNIALINKLSATPLTRPLANWSFQNPIMRDLLDQWMGIDRRRTFPAIAPQTFRETYSPQPVSNSRGRVILWDDTFLNYNDPHIGHAAIKLLTAMGYQVELLQDKRCCGRPLISKGMLDHATRHAEHNVKRLYPLIKQGIPVIGIEPSCIATLRDEYPDLLKSEQAARVAENSLFIEEFIAQKIASGDHDPLTFNTPHERQVIHVHGHCHQRALIGTDAMMTMLSLLPNTDVHIIDSGCCGMAGSFGYEKEHYDVSMAVGRDRLFPTLEALPADTLIVAPGTSCRHQIADAVQRQAIHPIVALADALFN